MDSSEALAYVDNLIATAKDLLKSPIRYPAWSKLDYSTKGVNILFQEFKEVAACGDYLSYQLNALLTIRADVMKVLREEQLRLQQAIDAELCKEAKHWQLQGLASNERVLMARMNVADAYGHWQKVQIALESFDEYVDVLKNKMKRLDDFRYAGQLLEKVLNFGHALQEL